MSPMRLLQESKMSPMRLLQESNAFLVTIEVPLSFAGSHATYLATIFPDLTSAPPTFLSKTCNPSASIAAPAKINWFFFCFLYIQLYDILITLEFNKSFVLDVPE